MARVTPRELVDALRKMRKDPPSDVNGIRFAALRMGDPAHDMVCDYIPHGTPIVNVVIAIDTCIEGLQKRIALDSLKDYVTDKPSTGRPSTIAPSRSIPRLNVTRRLLLCT